MVRHSCIPLESPKDWQDALVGMKHAFGHTWESCYAMHLTTGLKTYLYRGEFAKGVLVCPLAERVFDGHVDIVTPYGFSGFVGNGDCPEFSSHWRQFAKEQGYVCGYIGLNPLFVNDAHFDPHELHVYNSIYVLDLTLPEHELFANLSLNRKRQIRSGQTCSRDPIFDRAATRAFFLAHCAAFFRVKRASTAYDFSADTLSFLFGLDNLLAIGAQGPRGLEAVSVFTYTEYAAEYLFNISLPDGRHHAAHLLWCGVKHLKSLDIPLLNLGGGVHENDSVTEFKRRFGAKKLPLSCLKQVYDPATYECLCRQMREDPKDMTGYFPPYRRETGSR